MATMNVICPAYGRTGTTSLKEGLEILGFGPCYHMTRIFKNHIGTHPQLWLDGFQGRGLPIRTIFDGYVSVTDWPTSNFYQEMMREYPDAKIVLTSRDPDTWWKSVISTVHSQSKLQRSWGIFFLKALSPQFRRASYMLRHVAILNMEEAEAKAEFLRHTAEVKTVVPADKLLEFSLKDGWEPLCTFLGVPVPDAPFPRSNSSKEMAKTLTRLGILGWIVMLSAIATAGISVSVVSFIGGRHIGGVVAAVNICILSSCLMEATRISRFYGKKAT